MNTEFKPMHLVKVIQNKMITKGVHVVAVEKRFSFKPGEVISVQFPSDNNSRMYSILSGIKESGISFLFNIKPDGYLTNQLQNIKSGDLLEISDPFGTFLQRFPKNSICIATGTGIAPFYSLLRSGELNFKLIHGARTEQDFYFKDEFNKLGKNYIKCCSKESFEGAYHGRLTQFLKESDLNPSTTYFLCGNPEMVVDVREILLKKNIPFENIQTEIYF